MIRRVPSVVAAALLVCAGWTSAQIELTSFQTGDPIRADDVNGNFQELADAITAVADGEHRILPFDLVPLEPFSDADNDGGTPDVPTEFRYGVNNKFHLELTGSTEPSGRSYCFGSHVRLPDGATVVQHGATLQESDPGENVGDNDASATFYRQPFSTTDVEPPETIVETIARATTFQEGSMVGGGLPVTIENDAYTYGYLVCLKGDGMFLNARLHYTLP